MNCSTDLKKSWPSASNFKSFFTVVQTNFGNKILFLASLSTMPFCVLDPYDHQALLKRWENLRKCFQFGPILKETNRISDPEGFNLKFCFFEYGAQMESTFLDFPTFDSRRSEKCSLHLRL